MKQRPGEPGTWTSIVGANIKRLRDEHGWSLRELSAQLAGLDHALGSGPLSQMERALRRIDVEDIAALAGVFGLDPYELLMSDRERQRVREQAGMLPVEDLEAMARAAVDGYLAANGRVRNPDRSRGRG